MIIIALSIPVLIILFAFYFRRVEIKEFNNGICKCGGRFQNFDTDSQGGEGWKCESCGKYIWTSWINK